MKSYYVYILASNRNGTLYVGITSNLQRRIWEHKEKAYSGFTESYDVCYLVHYEIFDNPENAIRREKRLKKWNRGWKLDLIEQSNPNWQDLYEQLA